MTILNQIETDPSIKKEPVRIFKVTGEEEWRLDNKLHRENGPAVIRPFTMQKTRAIHGTVFGKFVEEWYMHGVRHRVDGPAYSSPLVKQWWLGGVTHRADGPAEIEYNVQDIDKPEYQRRVTKETYYVNGKKHRWDGPAVFCPTTGEEEWWVDGKRMDKLKEILADHCIEGPFTEWTDGEWMILRFALTEDLIKKE